MGSHAAVTGRARHLCDECGKAIYGRARGWHHPRCRGTWTRAPSRMVTCQTCRREYRYSNAGSATTTQCSTCRGIRFRQLAWRLKARVRGWTL